MSSNRPEDDRAARPLGFGDLLIDPRRLVVVLDGREVQLTYTEFRLLYYLARRPGEVFSRRRLGEELWDSGLPSGGRTIDVHVRRIRAKLGSSWIETVRQAGYRFRTGPAQETLGGVC